MHASPDLSQRAVRAHPLAAILLATTLLGLVVGCSAAPAPATPVPSPTPTVIATPGPSATTGDPGGGHVVQLATASGDAISIAVDDASGLLVSAESGNPGDGASVPPYELVVTNDDPTTLRLVWAGGPCTATDTLSIDATALAFLLVEPECPGDAIAFDRVLILHFRSPIAADDVRAILQDGLDTAG